MPPKTDAKTVFSGLTVSFLRSCPRIVDNVIWDTVDYYFRVEREGDSREVAVGIDGDWQDRLSSTELQKIAETWLLHRLEHFYQPFREPRTYSRMTHVPFDVVDFWLAHRRLPH
ncbi:MAG TPA: hypothetical protein VEI26_10690 [Terriglobales bacterium]|nr:hypothetical protein [Terriglobales bacterium]